MTIPNCTTENVLYAEPRVELRSTSLTLGITLKRVWSSALAKSRGSTISIPTLRRALARRMWGQGLGSVPEYDLSRGYARSLRGYAKSRRCSTAATFDFVAAVEHLRLNFVRPLSRSAELNQFRSALAKSRGSGSALHRKPQIQSAVALLNLGIKIIEP